MTLEIILRYASRSCNCSMALYQSPSHAAGMHERGMLSPSSRRFILKRIPAFHEAFLRPSSPSATLPLTTLLVSSVSEGLCSTCGLLDGLPPVQTSRNGVTIVVGSLSGDTDTGGELGKFVSYTRRLLYAVGRSTGAARSLGIDGRGCRAATSCASRLSSATACSTSVWVGFRGRSLLSTCRSENGTST